MPVKIICILDYCKTKVNGVIVISCRCAKLLILGYKIVQGVDSKVGGIDISFAKGRFNKIYAK